MAHLLRLPRELRDLIYEYYFDGEGGFKYDFVTNKLRWADGLSIDLSLVLACRQIAAETHGLALRTNTLRFKTFHSDHTQEHASVLHVVNREIYERQESLLDSLAPELLSQEQAQVAKSLYPQFAPVIDYWRLRGKIRHIGALCEECCVTPSIWRDFVAFTSNLISQQPGFLGEAKALKLEARQKRSGFLFGPRVTVIPDPDPHEDARTLALNEARPVP
jgi:hypothetical protein